jgi:hypothetical protein
MIHSKKYFFLLCSFFVLIFFPLKSSCQDWRVDLEKSGNKYIKEYSEFSFLELLQKRTALEEDFAKTYQKIFQIDPTLRIKIANYHRILNKSVDTFNRVDVNSRVIDQADKQFEKEFLPIAEKVDPEIREKYAKAMAMDSCLIKYLSGFF